MASMIHYAKAENNKSSSSCYCLKNNQLNKATTSATSPPICRQNIANAVGLTVLSQEPKIEQKVYEFDL